MNFHFILLQFRGVGFSNLSFTYQAFLQTFFPVVTPRGYYLNENILVDVIINAFYQFFHLFRFNLKICMILHLTVVLEFQGSFVAVFNLILYFTYFGGADTYGDDFPAQNCFSLLDIKLIVVE